MLNPLLFIPLLMIVAMGHQLVKPYHQKSIWRVVIYAAVSIASAAVIYVQDPTEIVWPVLITVGMTLVTTMVIIQLRFCWGSI